MTGLPMVISGMVINILLGAIAGAIILLNQDYAQNVFMWGAGDLAQNGWEMIEWLVPRLSPLVVLLLLAPRVLTLLRLGHQGAQARGLSVIPAFFLLMIIGIWLVSASITVVGLIGFIGLLTPNIVRALGARTPRMELVASVVFGALLLLLTDMLAQWLTLWFGQVVPSGVTAAAIGAPALIWFSRRRLKAQDGIAVALPGSRQRVSRRLSVTVAALLAVGVALYFCYQPDSAVHRHWPRAGGDHFAASDLQPVSQPGYSRRVVRSDVRAGVLQLVSWSVAAVDPVGDGAGRQSGGVVGADFTRTKTSVRAIECDSDRDRDDSAAAGVCAVLSGER